MSSRSAVSARCGERSPRNQLDFSPCRFCATATRRRAVRAASAQSKLVELARAQRHRRGPGSHRHTMQRPPGRQQHALPIAVCKRGFVRWTWTTSCAGFRCASWTLNDTWTEHRLSANAHACPGPAALVWSGGQCVSRRPRRRLGKRSSRRRNEEARPCRSVHYRAISKVERTGMAPTDAIVNWRRFSCRQEPSGPH
jgi:hypothetical protein